MRNGTGAFVSAALAVMTGAAAPIVFASAAGAQAASDPVILGGPAQAEQIRRSVAACPSLATTLSALKRSGKFRQIRVSTEEETGRHGPFRAIAAGDEIILADTWLEAQNVPFFDVRTEGEILPDNLCFGLGHLSEHLASPVSTAAESMDSYVAARLMAESKAFVRGWSYVVEAARIQNKGKTITPAQVAGLLMNLRYRFAFMRAMEPEEGLKLSFLADGGIADTDANLAAIKAALEHASIADLQ